jgi:hypothetical protein
VIDITFGQVIDITFGQVIETTFGQVIETTFGRVHHLILLKILSDHLSYAKYAHN